MMVFYSFKPSLGHNGFFIFQLLVVMVLHGFESPLNCNGPFVFPIATHGHAFNPL